MIAKENAIHGETFVLNYYKYKCRLFKLFSSLIPLDNDIAPSLKNFLVLLYLLLISKKKKFIQYEIKMQTG
jgi:hypothetical protein